ncbi:hypothetical protein ACQPYK_07020 [Streptosporangium sp. CA-135522]|uniref:hypothetical protein n=1 Tax=Streptosporangium sp. CA-135522 TaxID=3240072 RepID=UPI003D8F3032
MLSDFVNTGPAGDLTSPAGTGTSKDGGRTTARTRLTGKVTRTGRIRPGSFRTLSITTFQLIFHFPVPIMPAVLLDSVVRPRLRLFIQDVVYMPHTGARH